MLKKLLRSLLGKDNPSAQEALPVDMTQKNTTDKFTEIVSGDMDTNEIINSNDLEGSHDDIESSSQIIPVHQNVQDLVNKVLLTDSDHSRIAHFFRELIQLHGIKGEIQPETNGISVSFNGGLKKNTTIEKIFLEILSNQTGANFNRRSSYKKEILFNAFEIELIEESYPTLFKVKIKAIKKIGESELNTFKEIFENYILKNGNFSDNLIVDESFIIDKLKLDTSDIIILEEKELNIKKFTPENSSISLTALLKIGNKITSGLRLQDKWFVNISSYTGEQTFMIETIHDSAKEGILFILKIEKNSISIQIISLNNSFNRKFITSFLTPFLKEIEYATTHINEVSIVDYLGNLGIGVQENNENNGNDLTKLYQQEGFIGYNDIKDDIENGIIHAWKNKDEFEKIAREKYGNIKDIIPNATLFEGPAGTGKTTLARIIGSHLNYPFVYIPLNSFMSKWYGEAETRLATIFEKIGELAQQKGGAIIMIDEIDEIGGNRDNNHEATGKITGVLLKKLDGMERINNILLIGATNRKYALDPALISRFKSSHFFRLPNESEISQIISHYLPELNKIPESSLAPFAGKVSGRELKNICEDVTRIAIQNEISGNNFNLETIFLASMERSFGIK